MNSNCPICHRRSFLRTALLGSAALFIAPGAFADLLTTARQTEGPFFPDKLPLDTDNDLLILSDRLTPAVGEVTHLSGRVMDPSGAAMAGVLVEIWQVDGNGVYLHTRSGGGEKRDANFQGYGRFLTDRSGGYYFRTVKPVPYPGRTPHIHVKVSRGGKELLTTQLYIDGHPQNERDGLLRRIEDPAKRKTLLVPFVPIKDSTLGELSANFDIVIGVTPADAK